MIILVLLLTFCGSVFAVVPSFNQYLAQPTTIWVGVDGSFSQYKCIASTISITTNLTFNQYNMKSASITLSDGSPYNPDPPPLNSILTSAVAYWKFDEGTGTNVNDEIGTNDLTLSGNIAWVGGIRNTTGCYTANQTLGKIVSGSGLTPTSPFSISAWIYVNATDATYMQIFGSFPDSSPLGYVLYLPDFVKSTAGVAKCAIWESTVYHDVATSSKCVGSGNWVNVIWVQSEGNATVYTNGNLIQTSALNFVPDAGSNVSVGSCWANSGSWATSTVIDEVCVWSGRALTQGDAIYISTVTHSLP